MSKNKKTLAIFGCSFADPTCVHFNHTELSNYAWPNLLKQDYEVENYAKAGSSLLYSYRQFLETQANYDKIILSQTSYGRWFYPFNVDGKELHIPSLQTLIGNKNNFEKEGAFKRSLHLKNQINALEQYWLYLEDKRTSWYIDYAITQAFLAARKDILIIPRDFWQHTHTHFLKYFPAQQIRETVKTPHKWREVRLVSHFPIEYHLEFYHLIKEGIRKGSLDQLFFDKKLDLLPFDQYWESVE